MSPVHIRAQQQHSGENLQTCSQCVEYRKHQGRSQQVTAGHSRSQQCCSFGGALRPVQKGEESLLLELLARRVDHVMKVVT